MGTNLILKFEICSTTMNRSITFLTWRFGTALEEWAGTLAADLGAHVQDLCVLLQELQQQSQEPDITGYKGCSFSSSWSLCCSLCCSLQSSTFHGSAISAVASNSPGEGWVQILYKGALSPSPSATPESRQRIPSHSQTRLQFNSPYTFKARSYLQRKRKLTAIPFRVINAVVVEQPDR